MSNIVHIIYLDKFSEPYCNFVKSNFNASEHVFITYSEKNSLYSRDYSDLHLTASLGAYLKAVPKLIKADKIILHGAFSNKVLLFLYLQPWLLKKMDWVIWGKDLQVLVDSVGSPIALYVRKRVLSQAAGFITYLESDYKKAKTALKSTAKFKECIAYLSNVVSTDDVPSAVPAVNKCLLVGNSSDPSNMHEEVFKKLEPYLANITSVVVPLAYGDNVHAKDIRQIGELAFGEKFFPLLTMQSLEEYYKTLNSIDIAYFNHNRQQAMGNIIYLLANGKTVYLRKDTSSWNFFTSIGVEVNAISELSLEELPFSIRVKNSKLILSYFNKSNLKSQWAQIFNE